MRLRNDLRLCDPPKHEYRSDFPQHIAHKVCVLRIISWGQILLNPTSLYAFNHEGGNAMAAITFTTANFDSEVLQSDKPVLVDFWATWCGPCQKQGPIVEELADELTDIKIGKLDVDAEDEIAGRYNIMSIPTVMLFKNGEIASKAVGLQTKESLMAMIEG